MANFTKFFRNGKTFSAYCRMRYGQSKLIWDDSALWQKSGRFAIAFDVEAADAKFPPKQADKPAVEEYPDDGIDYERRQEEMLAYIASGTGLKAYYEDRDAGYAY